MPDNANIILSELLNLNNRLIQEPDPVLFIEKVMQLAARAADADGSFFFRVTPDKYMNLQYSNIQSLNAASSGLNFFDGVFIPDLKHKALRRPAEICAFSHDIVNVANIFQSADIDTSFISKFDEENNYATVSVLAFPLLDRKKNLMGVVQFMNARGDNGKIISFTEETQKMLISVCQLITAALERQRLAESYTQLLESFIEVLARAIDAKSPYTGSHCQKVPIITRMLATAAVEETEGPLQSFEMNDDDWYALHIASWLHDCGKVTTPEYIVDKATKLETIHNRIHEIRNRFEILRRDAHIEYLQKRLHDTDSKENLQAEFVAIVKKLEEDFAFIAQCNTGDTPLTEKDLARIDEISSRQFVRYFNRMLGLSWNERQNIKDPETYSQPAAEYLLQDLPDQLLAPFNQGELHNLKITRGTINKEERQKINEHIVATIDMLKALPFPKELANVVEYAGSHHEWVNGKGYPNGLTGEQMSIPAKIMAIADVFEALTAKDRPYKEPKKLSEVLSIMREMKNIGHLDPDLYEVFIRRGVYMEYAEQYIDKKQIDEINPEEYL